jgi:ATP-dependent RNA helicase DeaD
VSLRHETLETTIGPELLGALEKRGFERLTPVQEAVLAPGLEGKDLRISSQTGSGKTVAIGFVLRDALRKEASAEEPAAEAADSSGNAKGRDQRARPRALVVTPTRELAKQVEEELAWLYAPLHARVTSVTGGAGYRDELRAFRARPAIVVGTPGRLLDHLKRGAIDASEARTVVLDEADRMLDLGFREDLEAILGFAPPGHRTHLVSATFPRDVRTLADRVQQNPVSIEGTPLGTANLDIEHLVHLVQPRERLAAIINLLLEKPGSQTLIFARTRADVADLAEALGDAGFTVAMLSGEMEQAERNRALAAFKRGNVDALVATDVAARGIDVQDVARVLHAEPPDDADAYTHRSGRTGRAGKKGTSSVLATTNELGRVTALLGRARVRFRFAPIPSAESIRESRDESTFAELTADFVEGVAVDPRSLHLAERIIASAEPVRAVARLVDLATRRTQAEPRIVTPVMPPTTPQRERERDPSGDRARHPGPSRRDGGPANTSWVAFRVSWGESHGADPRRLVAMMCRRGNIGGKDIGAIRVGRTSSVIEVSAAVAPDFERATQKPDPRDPRVHVRRWSEEPTRREDRSPRPTAKERPSVPKDRPSVPKDRPSIPKDRPSIPKERPSGPKERAARVIVKDAPPPARPHAGQDSRGPKPKPTRGAPRPQTSKGGGGYRKGPPWASGGHGPPKRRRPT